MVLCFLSAQAVLAAANDKAEFINWHYMLGFDERLRVEYKRNFDFKKSVKDNGDLFFNPLAWPLRGLIPGF